MVQVQVQVQVHVHAQVREPILGLLLETNFCEHMMCLRTVVSVTIPWLTYRASVLGTAGNVRFLLDSLHYSLHRRKAIEKHIRHKKWPLI